MQQILIDNDDFQIQMSRIISLIHLTDELVQLSLSIASITVLNIVVPLLGEPTKRSAQLEGPQKVVGLLEARANSVNLVDEILNANDAILAKGLLDDTVVGQRGSALGELAVTTLVDQLPNTLQIGIPVGDIGLNPAQHVHGGLVHLHEHSVENLPKPQQLHDCPHLRMHVIDTPNTDDKHQLGLRLHIKPTLQLCLPLQTDQLRVLLRILLLVLLSTLEDQLPVLGTAGLGNREAKLNKLIRQMN